MNGRSVAHSERGRRRVNEDSVLVAPLDGDAELAAVADGMGGHAAGDVASRRALEALHGAVAAGADLIDAVRAANAAVHAEALARPEHAGMGTTLVALLRRGDRYFVANVGDSRAYRVDDSGVRRLTEDHSFVADAVRSGRLTAEEAGRSRWRNAVTRAIGTEPEIDVDLFGPFDAATPHTVVLCSDGLYRTLPEQRLRDVSTGALEHTARALADAALQAGSDDNISIVVVRFGEDPRVPRQPAADVTLAVQPAVPAGTQQTTLRNAPAPPRKRQAQRTRSRRPDLPGRWTSIEAIVILVAVLTVLVYVALLVLVF